MNSTDSGAHQTHEDRLLALDLLLPQCAPAPIGSFCNVRKTGNLLYVSGQGPITADGQFMTGKVGEDISAEVAREHARLVAINIIVSLRGFLNHLNSITGIVKLTGLVNATPDFERHPFVIDGASELMREVFGEQGIHSRTAFGVGSLPNRISVEIEAIAEVQ